MFERLTADARAVVIRAAQEEASRCGAEKIEVEHLLLALTLDAGNAGTLLAGVGLDHDAVRAALETEVEQSLAAVGVSLSAFDLPPATAPGAGRARLGTSAKLALERAVRAAVARGDRRIDSAHLLLGLLRAQSGTIPRSLAIAGVRPVRPGGEDRSRSRSHGLSRSSSSGCAAARPAPLPDTLPRGSQRPRGPPHREGP